MGSVKAIVNESNQKTKKKVVHQAQRSVESEEGRGKGRVVIIRGRFIWRVYCDKQGTDTRSKARMQGAGERKARKGGKNRSKEQGAEQRKVTSELKEVSQV